ncbi:hypothetical protein PFICI_08120 [Pestalotiopsis fici W106-1]|uniref:Zn(2)-C6 fungal-type domain-containing protein n=1 Tax=Pestalotiopsis fici (strain W106-1 / CGMCC3.15140) TaxID=1229662 RepID=W3X5Z0_PESFW|nr:uncharacterized protein PFICI_08120 [Pestalotiopsis fici W106-1]ETS80591.1 hypothetical protein PFICI_08120 [Pestalotiopsis fici W106-1]
MTSVTSASPSAQSHRRTESNEDSDSWQHVSSNPASVFFPSPGSGAGSMGSWMMAGYPNNIERSPQGMSPLHLDTDSKNTYSGSFPGSSENVLLATADDLLDSLTHDIERNQQFVPNQDFMYSGAFDANVDLPPYYDSLQNEIDFSNASSLDGLDFSAQPTDLGIPQDYLHGPNVSPWTATNVRSQELTFENTTFAASDASQASPGSSSHHSPRHSPISPPAAVAEKAAAAPPKPSLRKLQGKSKVEKKKAAEPASSKFLIMTPMLINAASGKPNPYECFEAMRMTHKGRKGPLANDTKENALHVRRLGACFCCHARKVKCDKERPCKNCSKLTAAVPQIMCWQFQDFLPVLFPDFIRGHFKKDQMAAFVAENIESFTVGGVESPCEVELFSGTRFDSTLKVRAKFFTAKTREALQHWHMNDGLNQLDLQSRSSAPIGIELDNATYRDELRKRTRDYIQKITLEPQYAEQVTDSCRHTTLPWRVLKIVQRFGQRSDSPMVKKALSIYAMHYVLTRHLCITPASIHALQHTNLMPRNVPWLTPRVLNRQIKSLLDEHLLKEMQALFEGFARSLKPKTRGEWAPCLAAFLVLCLFMETVEAAADTFVVAQNQVDGLGGSTAARPSPEYQRDFALRICREVENMPFKQFAYQFHQIYQTHTKDISTKAFNPLVDDSFVEQGDLDMPASEMVASLKELLQGDSYYELDFLVADPILPNEGTHTFPRDASLNYTGRLLARFLLSFLDDRYLFDGRY